MGYTIFGRRANGESGPIRVGDDGSLAIGALPAAPAYERDLFGRQRTSDQDIVFASSSAYDLDPLIWETRASGAGNGAAWSANARAVILTLAAAGYVVRQTRRYIVYQPGRPVRVILTGNLGAVQPGVVSEWGQFDATNGVFWRRDATGDLALVVRSSTSGSVVDQVISRAQWNGDPLASLNPAYNQVWFVEYAWLGTAGVRWGILQNRVPIYCHTEEFTNVQAVSYMQTATLPLRWQLSAAQAPAATATMQQVCSEIESEGGYLTAPSYTYSAGRRVANAISTASEAPIVAIRPALTFGGIPNRIQIDAQEVDILAASGSVDWRLLYYPPGTANPVTGGTWAAANDASGVEANVAGTALSLAGAYEIARGGVAAGGATRGGVLSAVRSALPLVLDMAGSNNPLTSAAGGNPATLVVSALGTGATASGGLRWGEQR